MYGVKEDIGRIEHLETKPLPGGSKFLPASFYATILPARNAHEHPNPLRHLLVELPFMGGLGTEPQRRAAAYLREYSQKYGTVEIDSWFYKIPEPEEVADYLAQVAPSFRFTCKVPQELTLTHLRGSGDASTNVANPAFLSPERFERFLEAIEPMLPRLDAIMFEFEYLNRDKMPSLEAFLERLDDFLAAAGERVRGLPLAIETRNKNYLTAAYFNFLRERRLMPVFSEKIFMPHVYNVYRQYKDSVTTDVVIRLLGDDRAEIEKKTNEQWNAIVEPKPDKEAIVSPWPATLHIAGTW